MIASLSFNLPEDQHEFDCTVNGHKWRGTVEDIIHEIRRMEEMEQNEAMLEKLGRLRSYCFQIINENGLQLY